MVTGPVTKNMREALLRTYNATPDPKWVVAVGACAVDGGIFAGSYAVAGGVRDVVPVDLHIRGCPPSPGELLKGLMALLDGANGATLDKQGWLVKALRIDVHFQTHIAARLGCTGEPSAQIGRKIKWPR